MATHKSAEKRARQSIVRTDRNTAAKSRIKSLVRSFRETLETGDKAAAEAKLLIATRALRKAASSGLMHQRSASRHVSRLVLAFNGSAKSA